MKRTVKSAKGETRAFRTFNDLEWDSADGDGINLNIKLDAFENLRSDFRGSLHSSSGATSGTSCGGSTGSRK